MGGGCGKRRCWDGYDIFDKVKGVIFGKESSGTSSYVAQQEAYDPEKARLVETVRINNALTEFVNRISVLSDKVEREALESSREYLDDLIDYLRKINQKEYAGQKLNINLERIQRYSRQVEDTIRSYIKRYVKKRVSTDDAECLEILKMNNDTKDEINEKSKRMELFLNKVLKEAMSGLSKEIRRKLKEQSDFISEQIEERLELYNMIAQEKVKNCQNILSLKGKDEEKLQINMITVIYKQSLCEQILIQMEEK